MFDLKKNLAIGIFALFAIALLKIFWGPIETVLTTWDPALEAVPVLDRAVDAQEPGGSFVGFALNAVCWALLAYGVGLGTRAIGLWVAQDAARAAVDSALLDLSIQGAKRILFTVSGTPDMTMQEINEAAKIITESIDPQAKVIFGAVVEDKTRRGPLRITLIASGFPGKEKSKPQGNLQIFRR